MLSKFRPRSAYDVMAGLSLFLVLTGGTAVALSGSNTVFSDDITNGEVKNPDIAEQAVGTGKVKDESLSGQDIRPNSIGGPRIIESSLSGLDRCPAGTVKLGRLCVRSDGVDRTYPDAHDYCEALDMRFPAYSEARTLGDRHDIPNVSDGSFWTDEESNGNVFLALDTENGELRYGTPSSGTNTHETVCVTTPQN